MAGSPEPRSGDDTYDLIDDAVAALADRRGTWLGDDIAAMALIASLIDPGRTMAAAARARRPRQRAQLGRDRPGAGHVEARLRFDPQSPVADGRWPYDF